MKRYQPFFAPLFIILVMAIYTVLTDGSVRTLLFTVVGVGIGTMLFLALSTKHR